MQHDRKRALRIETLEDRSMFAVAVVDHGTLSIIGNSGNDNIQISMQSSSIHVVDKGVAHNYNANRIVVLGLGGNDTITVDPNVTIPVWIDGGNGNDTLQGGSGNDVILGGGGNDTIFGGAGNDKIFGGGGNDVVDAGAGDDGVTGGQGDDIIHGGDDNDTLFGSAGNDQLYGEGGQDICDGGVGDDRVDGGDLNDQLFGGKGFDLLLGGDGDDYLFGGVGNDTCQGGAGNDKIKGGAGNDVLNGESGNNLLDTDLGADTTSNGIVVDLDRECSATLRGKVSGHSLSATYTLSNNNGTLEEAFTISDSSLVGGGSHDIVVDGVTIGQFDYPGGSPYIVYKTNPGGSPERPIPVDFPEIHPGTKVAVGSFKLPKMQSIYDLSPAAPTLPRHFV